MKQRSNVLAGAALAALLAVGAAACGSDDSAGGNADDPAARGKQVALENGCAACHGTDGQGGVGPSFVGLAGSTVELEDGTTLVADSDYLRRSIVDPSAEVVAGYSVNMPQRTFEPGDVDLLVAWIESLG